MRKKPRAGTRGRQCHTHRQSLPRCQRLYFTTDLLGRPNHPPEPTRVEHDHPIAVNLDTRRTRTRDLRQEGRLRV